MLNPKNNDVIKKMTTPKPMGLTGGIASGKSTVCELLKSHNFEVINSDTIVHSLYSRDYPRYIELAEDLDNWLLTDFRNAMEIDRTELRRHMKSSPKSLDTLSRIILPYYLEKIEDIVQKSKNPGRIIIEVPLLFESKLEKNFDKIITVYADRDTQIERVKKRNPNLSIPDINAFLAAQMSNEEKMKLSHHVVLNSSAVLPEVLKEKVAELAQELSGPKLQILDYQDYNIGSPKFRI